MEFPAIIKEELLEENYNTKGVDTVKMEPTEELQEDWCIQDKIQESFFYKKLTECILLKCTYCEFFFMNRFSLYQHNLIHLEIPLTEPKLYPCYKCSVYFINKQQLTDHHEKHFNISMKLMECHICHKIYKYKHWHQHMASVHQVGKHKCSKCGIIFKCARYLKKHEKFIHEGVERYAPKIESKSTSKSMFCCDHCPKSFEIKNKLSLHIQNCHGKSAKCKICKSTLKSDKYLKEHMRRVHYNDGQIHRCPICHKIFKSPRYVRVHIKNSHERNPLICRRCDAVYLCAKSFDNHTEKCLLVVKDEVVE